MIRNSRFASERARRGRGQKTLKNKMKKINGSGKINTKKIKCAKSERERAEPLWYEVSRGRIFTETDTTDGRLLSTGWMTVISWGGRLKILNSTTVRCMFGGVCESAGRSESREPEICIVKNPRIDCVYTLIVEIWIVSIE